MIRNFCVRILGVRAAHKIKAGAAGCDPCFMLFRTVKFKEQVADVITERNVAPPPSPPNPNHPYSAFRKF